MARNALAVVTAQSHSRANGIARAAYACSGAVHCGLVLDLQKSSVAPCSKFSLDVDAHGHC